MAASGQRAKLQLALRVRFYYSQQFCFGSHYAKTLTPRKLLMMIYDQR